MTINLKIHCLNDTEALVKINKSDLQPDLFARHVADIKHCVFGAPGEDAEHYILKFTKLKNPRNFTIQILPPIAISVECLLLWKSIIITCL